MKQYHDLLKEIKNNGILKPASRENMPSTTSLFGYQFRVNLQEGFPLLTTKKINFNNIVVELLWFLKGNTNIKYLIDNGFNAWNEDAYNYYKNNIIKKYPQDVTLTYEEFIEAVKKQSVLYIDFNGISFNDCYIYGDCGNQYGKTWRYFNDEIDQINNLIYNLKTYPESRRHVVSSIDPINDQDLALYWCHSLFQFNVRTIDNVNYLDCQLYQRSADVFLGVPYNIASYSLLTHLIAKICNYEVGDFIHTFGDVHIYSNHLEQVNTQLERTPKQLPTLCFSDSLLKLISDNSFDSINDLNNIFNKRDRAIFNIDTILEQLTPDMFYVENYNPDSFIKAKLSTGLK
jgi:thymidylate synthase